MLNIEYLITDVEYLICLSFHSCSHTREAGEGQDPVQTSGKFVYSFKILCFRPLLISFTHQNGGTDCMINMACVRFAQ